MSELRDKTVSARIKPRAKRIMENSKYSYGDAIEYFAFNVLNKNEDEMQRLKHLKIESRRLQAELNVYRIEIDLICKDKGIKPNDDLLFADEIQKNIKSVVRWYKREKGTYGTIENFLELKFKQIKPYAQESGLELEDFNERVISDYYSKNKEK